MPETKTGATEQAAAATQTGANAEVAAQQTGETESQVAAEKTVPLEALEAERQKRQEAEQQRDNLNAQFQLIQNQQVQAMPKEAKSYFDELGVEPGGWPTREQVEAYIEKVRQDAVSQTTQTQQQANSQRFIESKNDYAEKVGVQNFMGQFEPSKTLIAAMQDDPSLARDYRENRITPQSAYRAVTGYLAKKELAKVKASAKEQETQETVALKTNPLPASAVGGGGSAGESLDARNPDDRQKILERAQRMQEGDYD